MGQLVHHQITSLHGGISNQSPELRFDNQVEDMENCHPSIDKGTRRRNPTAVAGNAISLSNDGFVHSYENGLAGDSKESFIISIDGDKSTGQAVLKVHNALTGEQITVTPEDSSTLDYLYPFVDGRGYSAITVGDSTFIVNKNKTVLLKDSIASDPSGNLEKTIIAFNEDEETIPSHGPFTFDYPDLYGATVVVSIDTYEIRYTTNVYAHPGSFPPVETYQEWKANLYSHVKAELPSSLYSVEFTSEGIVVKRAYDGSPSTPDIDIEYPVHSGCPACMYYDGTTATFCSISREIDTGGNPLSTSEWDSVAYVWIKSANPVNNYTYTITLDGTNICSVSGADTATVVGNILLNVPSGYSATAYGSISNQNGAVVRFQKDTGAIDTLSVSDSFGDQASFGWLGTVNKIEDLPAKMNFSNVIVHVVGDANNEFDDYYVMYDGNTWVETKRPEGIDYIDKSTMPHKLTMVSQSEFSFASVDYDGRVVGDENTSSHPSFVDDKILDVFFFRNRLCFTSSNNVIMSEVGNFYNFYRTTVLAVLDSDSIDVSVDSVKSVFLEYATALNDYVVLFSDTQQFKLSGGDSLTPSSILAQIATAYEFNKNVQPILVDNRVYFALKRGQFSAIMEYSEAFASTNTNAEDITAHVSELIDGDIVQMVGSSTSRMLFVRSKTEKRTVYVYNYMFQGRERIQSCWHKWTFNADVNSIFVIGNRLYLITDRSPSHEAGEIDTWDDTMYWDDDGYWVDEYGAVVPSFEYINLEQYDFETASFIDLDTDEYDSRIVLSEWVMQSGDIKDIRGHLQFKTTKIEATGDSKFELTVKNKESGKQRIINQKYVVGRRPLIMGKAKDTELTVSSVNSDGFQIDAISHEGRYNSRSRRT